MALYSVVALNLISTQYVRGIRRSFSVVRDLVSENVTFGKFFKLTHIQPTFKICLGIRHSQVGQKCELFPWRESVNSLVFVAEDIDDEPSDRIDTQKNHWLTQENLHLTACLNPSAFINAEKSIEVKKPKPQRKSVGNVYGMKTTMFGKIPRPKALRFPKNFPQFTDQLAAAASSFAFQLDIIFLKT